MRKDQIHDIRYKERQAVIKRIKEAISPGKLLEDRKQRIIDQTRNEYLKRVVMNHDEAERNLEKMKELQRMEMTLLERL